MNENDLLSYLRHAKDALKPLPGLSKVHVVVGNEACDLDSAVCAIVYAFYLHKTWSESSKAAYIPVLNIAQADYALHTEVTFALQGIGITEDSLVFRDQIDLVALRDNRQLTLTLVDHHTLSPGECSLEGAVREVIDHRPQVKEFCSSVDVTMELVGSCCTLLAEKLLSDVTFDLDTKVAQLLLGTILLDTVCLSEAAGKTTTKDISLVEKLEALVPHHSRQATYDTLLNARRQISGLSALDVLRKDLKVVSSQNMRIAISSVPSLIEVFLARDDVSSAFEAFTRQHHVEVTVVMGMEIATSGDIHRQLAIHSFSPVFRDQVIDVLVSTGPVLGLGVPIATHFKHIRAFEQNNGKASRKKLLPFIERYLSDIQSPKNNTVDSGMKLQEASDGESRTDTGIDLSLNVVAGMIADDMKRLESAQNHIATRGMAAAENNVVARNIAAEMQLQEKLKMPSSEVIVLDRSADINSRGSSEKKKLSVRYGDEDTVVMVSSDGHEDQVRAVAEQLVFTAVTSAVDIHLNSAAQSGASVSSMKGAGELIESSLATKEYAHPEIALRGGDKEAGSGNEEKVDEPNMEIGAGMNPAEPSGGLGGQLEDTTPGVARRPTELESTPKKKIVPLAGELLRQEDIDVSVGSSSSSDVALSLDGKTPDDLTTPDVTNDSVFGSLDWASDAASSPVESIPEYTAQEEYDDEHSWKAVQFGNKCYRIDMKVIEPYKQVVSHGGYYGDGFNAIVVLAACHLPDKRRRDYNYVMDNLFLYVLNTLDLLVVEDYVIVYFHGAAPSHKIPSVRWLKRCYDLIDRRLRKNLKKLMVVHPTLWLKTVALMSRPFISSKFLSKLKYVKDLEQLKDMVPMEHIHVPEEVKRYKENKLSTPSPT